MKRDVFVPMELQPDTDTGPVARTWKMLHLNLEEAKRTGQLHRRGSVCARLVLVKR